MTVLYLVRHGQAGELTGHYDTLSDRGWRQSELLGEHMRACDRRFDEIWCGTLQRHRLTLDAFHQTYPLPHKAWHDPALDEIPFEALLAQYQAQFPEHAARHDAGADQSHAAFANTLRHAIDLWRGDLLDGLEPTWVDYKTPVTRWLEGRTLAATPGKHVLAISSAGTISLLLSAALQLDDSQMHLFNAQLRNTAVTALELNPTGPVRLALFNSVAHLDVHAQPALITSL
ncbi:MAG: histidine phosphatase family protein [Pseudomonadota bacterium]